MEWVVLLAVALAAALYIGWPTVAERSEEPNWGDDRRRALLRALAELDTDLEQGRISQADRRIGRQALGAELRTLLEAGRRPATPPREPRCPTAAAGTATATAPEDG